MASLRLTAAAKVADVVAARFHGDRARAGVGWQVLGGGLAVAGSPISASSVAARVTDVGSRSSERTISCIGMVANGIGDLRGERSQLLDNRGQDVDDEHDHASRVSCAASYEQWRLALLRGTIDCTASSIEPQPSGWPMSVAISPHEEVSAVIVTYDDRYELCRRVVQGALACGVGRVVIVDNGSRERARDALAAVAAASGGVVELDSVGRNLGSAGGFGRGIEVAFRRRQCSQVWLLDDDTVPEATALDELLAWGARLSPSTRPDVALVSYRPARLVQRLLVRGSSAGAVFPSRSAVMGFNVADIFRKAFQRLVANRRSRSEHPVREPIQIPYGPYGGLLISRELIGLVGYPNEQLFVYEDDTDYTWRLAAASGLFLVPKSLLIDLEPSWPDRARGNTMFGRALTSESPGRVFYQVRNRVFFEVQHWVGSTWLHRTNRSVYLALLWLSAVRLRRMARYRLIASAVRAGERAHLGVVRDLSI